MSNLPIQYDDTLRGGSPEQLGAALGALFRHFPIGRDIELGEVMPGYLDALRGEPAWAVEKTARNFIGGRIESHDGRFLPSAAEFAKAARAETDFYRQQAAANQRVAATQHLIKAVKNLTPDEKKSRAAQVSRALEMIGKTVSHNDVLFTPDGRARKWPDGTTFEAKRGIITYPTGTTISYADWWEQKQAKARTL